MAAGRHDAPGVAFGSLTSRLRLGQLGGPALPLRPSGKCCQCLGVKEVRSIFVGLEMLRASGR